MIKQHIQRALSLPFRALALKVFQILLFRIKSYWFQLKDTILITYSSNKIRPKLNQLFPCSPDPATIREDFPELEELIKKTLNHEFNLLGSNWTKVHYGMDAKGISGIKYHSPPFIYPKAGKYDWISQYINRANQKTSREIWGNISLSYQPIDWHIDFKSGFRWNSTNWCFRVPYGHKPGVDIKVPWEISRSQHMPWLALGYGLYKHENNQPCADELAIEFQNQLFDFISTNPPNFGVNWRGPMDVAIRATNWILAYEFFKSYGWQPSEKLNMILANSLHDHGRFIFSHLEIDKDGTRGNHYLSNVCGLAFISSFLPDSKKHNEWFDFSFRAFLEEMDYQFFDDGANFEGSTSYHQLSAELMLYTTLMFENLQPTKRSRLPHQLFTTQFYRKLFNMGLFSECITKPDQNICQIGDNDNGRFFKIKPDFHKGTLNENHISHKNFSNSINAFFKKNQLDLTSKWIFKNSKFHLDLTPECPPSELNQLEEFKHLFDEIIFEYLKNVQTTSKLGLLNQKYHQNTQLIPALQSTPPEHFIFKDFGLCIWKSTDFFMSFRCGPIGQKGRGGHDHNDQLSFELYTNEIKMEDPGTGIYTPFPQVRNQYRSIAAHFSPQVVKRNGKLIEPGSLEQGLFSLNSNQNSKLLFASKLAWCGYNQNLQTLRIIINQMDQIFIQDICLNPEWKIKNKIKNELKPSKGYGLF